MSPSFPYFLRPPSSCHWSSLFKNTAMTAIQNNGLLWSAALWQTFGALKYMVSVELLSPTGDSSSTVFLEAMWYGKLYYNGLVWTCKWAAAILLLTIASQVTGTRPHYGGTSLNLDQGQESTIVKISASTRTTIRRYIRPIAPIYCLLCARDQHGSQPLYSPPFNFKQTNPGQKRKTIYSVAAARKETWYLFLVDGNWELRGCF